VPGELLRALAIPRQTGTAGAAHVETLIRSHLEALGWSVHARRFGFSGWPVRHGVRLLGLVLATTLPFASQMQLAGHAAVAAFTLLLLLGVSAGVVAATGRMVLEMPWSRSEGVNLLALPRVGHARFLIVAHRDSKSQPVPLALRVSGAALVLAGWLALVATVLADFGSLSVPLARAAGLAGLAGGIIIAGCGVGNDSAGALDNASGVAALLRIAEQERSAIDVALLVTDGEEFGLAGARAAAALRTRTPGGHIADDNDARVRDAAEASVDDDAFVGAMREVEAVINLDGLDDRGTFFLLEGPLPAMAKGSLLAAALVEAGRGAALTVRRRPIPPGLLLDHLAFRRAGLPALTLMRGGVRSLARVHRPADRADRLTGDGAERAASMVSAALARLRGPTAAMGGRVALPATPG
jgi:hypothetical protein